MNLLPGFTGGRWLCFVTKTKKFSMKTRGFVRRHCIGTLFFSSLIGFFVAPVSALSDLIVQNLAVNPASGLPGAAITVTFRIYNQGAGTANASTTRIRYSEDSSLATSDPLLSEFATTSIAAGSYVDVTKALNIPTSGATAGSRYIGVTLDVNSTANQSNESNDQGLTGFTVTSPPTYSDLIVQNLAVSPTSGLPGAGITVTFRIYNQGAGTANASTTRIRYSEDSSLTTSDPLLSEFATASMAAGSYIDVSKPLYIPTSGATAGSRYIGATVDVNNVANQSNVSNDQALTGFTVTFPPSQPDLIPQSLSISPNPITAGNALIVNYMVRKQGVGSAAQTSTKVRIVDASNILVVEQIYTTIALAAGASTNESRSITIPSGAANGSYTVKVFVDNYTVLSQSDVSNDMVSTGLTINAVVQQSDLVVQNLAVSPTSGLPGAGITVTFRIYNQGAGTANASTTRIRYSEDSSLTTSDPLLSEFATASMAAGSYIDVSKPLYIPTSGATAGSRYIGATVDVNNVANQSNVSNDQALTGFTVTFPPSQPDLIPQSLSISPNPITAGNALIVNYMVRKQGVGSAAQTSTKVRIVDASNILVVEQIYTTIALAAGASTNESRSITIPSGAANGSYTVKVFVDNYTVLSQSDVSNDMVSTSLTVNAVVLQPDLIPQSLSVSPNPITAGNALTVNYTVTNQGGGSAAQTSTKVRIVDASNTLLIEQVYTTIALGAGASINESRSITIPPGAASGSYTVKVFVDNYTALSQNNTANDMTSTSLTVSTLVQLTDLIPQSLIISPNPVVAGNVLTVNYTVTNQGSGSAAATYTKVKIKDGAGAQLLAQEYSTIALGAGASTQESHNITIPASAGAGNYTVWVMVDCGGRESLDQF